MPRARTAVTAGDHIDWMTTSPAAIRFTDSSKVVQNARNWPDFFASTRILIVLSISSFVMFPLSPYLTSPRDSIAIAASMIPIDGTSRMAERPLNSGFRSSCQCSIGRFTRSGRIPSVSALYTVGIAVAHRVWSLANFFDSGLSTYWTLKGSTPCRETFRPSGYSPFVKIGTTLSHHLYFLRSIVWSTPRGTRW